MGNIMPFCEECGTKLGENWKYCHNCGASIPNLADNNQKPLSRQKKSSKYNTDDILDTIGCILLIIAVIVVLIIYNFFIEWFDLIITIVILLFILSCVGRLLYALIGEIIIKLREKRNQKKH